MTDLFDGKDPINEAIETTRLQVAPISGDQLINRAKAARFVAVRRKRRMVQVITASTAAVIVLTVGVVAVTMRQSPSQHVTMSVDQVPADGHAPGSVHVEPNDHLRNGQKVWAKAYGFDADTSVVFRLCVDLYPGTQPYPPPSSVPMGPPTKPDVPDTASSQGAVAPARGSASPGASIPQATPTFQWVCKTAGRADATGSTDYFVNGDAQPSLKVTVARAAITVTTETKSFTTLVTSEGLTSPAQGPICSEHGTPNVCRGGITSYIPSNLAVSTCTDSGRPRCVVVATGNVNGQPRAFQSGELIFANSGTTSSPASPDDPQTMPPASAVPTSSPNDNDCNYGVNPQGGCVITTMRSTVPRAPVKDCPVAPPDVASPGTPARAAGPLLDFIPTDITICHYPVELGPAPGSPTTVRDPTTIAKITRALRGLHDVPGNDLACTMEMGETVVLMISDATRTTQVTVQFYGCGMVSNGDAVRTGGKDLYWIARIS